MLFVNTKRWIMMTRVYSGLEQCERRPVGRGDNCTRAWYKATLLRVSMSLINVGPHVARSKDSIELVVLICCFTVSYLVWIENLNANVSCFFCCWNHGLVSYMCIEKERSAVALSLSTVGKEGFKMSKELDLQTHPSTLVFTITGTSKWHIRYPGSSQTPYITTESYHVNCRSCSALIQITCPVLHRYWHTCVWQCMTLFSLLEISQVSQALWPPSLWSMFWGWGHRWWCCL